MTLLIQQIVNLAMLASVYTLIAIGLSLIFSVMRVINFAHAQLYMVGAFALYLAYTQASLPYPFAVAIAGVASGAVGLLTLFLVIRPLQDDPLRAMVGTLGVLVGLGGVASIVFGEQDKYAPPPFPGAVDILGANVALQKIAIASVAAGLVVALFLFLRSTRAGRALRALAQDQTGARLQGIRVERVQALGFAIGSGLAGVAGALLLPVSVVNPQVGQPILLKMFVILILGGLGSLEGAVVGALVLAAIETLGVTYLGQYSVFGAYLLVIAVLVWRPAGILGREA